MRIKPRTYVAQRLKRLAEKWLDRTLLPIDFPPSREGPRYGYGRPPHARLQQILERDRPTYRRHLERVLDYRTELVDIPARAEEGPCWLNAWLPPFDGAAIYYWLRSRDPARYVEVGSGMSTLFARRAVDDGKLGTEIVSIDPEPRMTGALAAAHKLIRAPLEAYDLGVFERLSEGDVLFFDGSHRVLMNSDVVVFFLEVLPELPDGVLVGVHDILWPLDYLPQWTEYHWSEQYLVAAHLLAEGDKTRCEMATHFAAADPELGKLVAPLWDELALPELARSGVALWLTTTNRG